MLRPDTLRVDPSCFTHYSRREALISILACFVAASRFPNPLKFDQFVPLVPSRIGASPKSPLYGFNSLIEAPSAFGTGARETKNNNQIHFKAPSGAFFCVCEAGPMLSAPMRLDAAHRHSAVHQCIAPTQVANPYFAARDKQLIAA